MNKFLKNNYWLIIVFIISLICLYLGFNYSYSDPLDNYGFAKAIAKGEIPYLDFNLITTPLYAFITSLGLHIYDNFLTFLIEQAILITACYYFVYQLYGKKSIILYLVTIILQYINIGATYNFMCFFIMILLIYMENKHQDKDYLIGIFIALAILSKQTVGLFLMLPSIFFYYKDIKKLKKRFIGFSIPCFIFLIYLIVNKCLYQFFDLCLFGMLDFTTKNAASESYYLILTLIMFCIMIFLMLRHKENKDIYYLISGVLFAIPICDKFHFSLFNNCFIIAILPYIKINENVIFSILFPSSIIISIIIFSMWPVKVVFTKDFNHFQFFIHTENEYYKIKKIHKFIDKYKDKNLIILGYESIRYNIINDNKIDQFFILNDGNYGYNGTDKMIDRIKKMHNYTFIVSLDDYNRQGKTDQFSKKIVKYVINNTKQIAYNKKLNYAVYYKE